MHDIIVIGGGPTGSLTARRLAEKGYKILVLDKNPGAGGKTCCTGIVGRECVETFDIDKKVRLRELNSAKLFPPCGNALYLHRKETQAVVLDRQAFDVSMAERAQRAGVEYRFNSHVKDITISREYVNVDVAGKNKNYKEYARAAVIAWGFNPGINERAGLGTFKDHAVGAQAEVETTGLEEVEVYFGNIAPGFFGWLAPTTQGRVKAGLLSRGEPGLLLKKWLKQLEEQKKIVSADVKLHYGGIPLKPPTRTYGERLIAVGDAAGQVKPTSGGGIFYGLLGAETGAKVLQQALEDKDLSEKRLAAYQRAWQRRLGGELRTGYWARKIFERMSERQIDRLFKVIKSSGIDKALLEAKDLSFDWHSRTISSLLKYQIITKTLNVIKLPFMKNGVDR